MPVPFSVGFGRQVGEKGPRGKGLGERCWEPFRIATAEREKTIPEPLFLREEYFGEMAGIEVRGPLHE